MRIELNWGGGGLDVILDLRSGDVILYNGQEDVHSRFGGKCYYTSRTGLSGAGWVPARPWLKLVAGYRVDVSTRNMFGDLDRAPAVAGRQVFVPYDYQATRLADDYPVVVRDAGWAGKPLVMLRNYEVVSHLAGKGERELEDREIQFSAIRLPGTVPDTWTFTVRVPQGARFLGLRRVVEGIHHEELSFQACGEGNYGPEEMPELLVEPFWNRLGLWRVSGEPVTDFYKITGGIARRRYSAEELASVEGLQFAAPANTVVLTPHLYLQERDGYYDAVGLFELDGEEVDYEVGLEPAEGVRAMRGDFEEVRERLEEGARAKHDADLESRRQMEKAAADIRNLCEQHIDVEVTPEDSVAAGNCRVGTDAFRQQFFAGREFVRVRELVPHLANPGVRRVLEHKLLPLTGFPRRSF